MISVDEALAHVLALAPAPEPEHVDLAEADGRVLLEPARAQLSQPPFDASAMDGYALRRQDGSGPLQVIGSSAAGHPWNGQAEPGTAVRIFTGAPVPQGYDHVEIQENIRREGDVIYIESFSEGRNIRLTGNDFLLGSPFFPRRALSPADIGLIAAMNVPRVTVARRPRVAILAGGDELVRPGQSLAPGQIVSSNDLALVALARQAGASADLLPIARDTTHSLSEAFDLARGYDLVVTIGGASVGDHDLVGKVAQDHGLDRSFYKVAMRPGKPLLAGSLGKTPMLGLPGNPVSAMVCAILFLKPLIARMQGLTDHAPIRCASLGRDLPDEGSRQHYLRAALVFGPDGPEIHPFPDQDSARTSLMADADALLIRPAHDPARTAGERMAYIPLRP